MVERAGSVVLVALLMGSWGSALLATVDLLWEQRKTKALSKRTASLADFMALFVALLPPLAFSAVLRSSVGFRGWDWQGVFLASLLILMFAVIWWDGCKLLNRLEVIDGRRRFCFLALFYPCVFAGGPAALFVLMLLVGLVATGSEADGEVIAGAIGITILGTIEFIGLRWVRTGAWQADKPDDANEQPLP